MRKILSVFLLSLLCSFTGPDKRINKWIKKAAKPIVVQTLPSTNIFNQGFSYNLVDANGRMFYTGVLYQVLPDTIYKPIKWKKQKQ